jgi:hypothetical protein
MYSEGSGKGILAILIACLAAVVATNWHATLFLLQFVWDLIVIHAREALAEAIAQWPFLKHIL